MFSNPFRPDASMPPSNVEIKPTDEDVVRALFEIEKASIVPPPVDSPLTFVDNRPFGPATSNWLRGVMVLAIFAVVTVVAIKTWLRYASVRQTFSSQGKISNIDRNTQTAAEQMLRQLASNAPNAADQVLSQSENWIGKTHRTPQADQSILIALNLSDMHAREAAIAAELALDAVPQNETGLAMLQEALGDPNQRVWALWMLGALGNRGVEPVRTAKILESYLAEPDINVRASAVNGLSLLATDETVPMLLDRFRNDSSPVVQERAACGLAESGMFTRDQRMTAAASIVGWLDDPQLTPQERVWSFQALHDISGKNLGTDSAAWRNWYETPR
jgi:HEAT repeats